jgi:hypothetical protein
MPSPAPPCRGHAPSSRTTSQPTRARFAGNIAGHAARPRAQRSPCGRPRNAAAVRGVVLSSGERTVVEVAPPALSGFITALSASGTLARIGARLTRNLIQLASQNTHISGHRRINFRNVGNHRRSAKRRLTPANARGSPHPWASRPPAAADRDRLSNPSETNVTLRCGWSWDDGESKTVFYFEKCLTWSWRVC